jgi:hypothetical protein
MDFWVILYSLICVVVGAGSASFLYKRGQSMAAMIALVLLILVFVFYGLRWFPGGNLNGTKPAGGAWPPIVNMCPDFMASFVDSSNKVYCYDAANIYNMKSATAGTAGLAATSPTINGAAQAAYLLQNPGATDKNPLKTTLKNSATTLTQDSNGKYVRWEGVWDGRSVTTDRIPSI